MLGALSDSSESENAQTILRTSKFDAKMRENNDYEQLSGSI
jgi:hypothetical protein